MAMKGNNSILSGSRMNMSSKTKINKLGVDMGGSNERMARLQEKLQKVGVIYPLLTNSLLLKTKRIANTTNMRIRSSHSIALSKRLRKTTTRNLTT
jgi:hypothetical protein